MFKEITVPYGHKKQTLRIPADKLAWVVGPKDTPPVANLADAIRTAIRSPIGAPTLAELVKKHGTQTVILVDDSTRVTPQTEILPALLDELNTAGVLDTDITVLIALGTHRQMGETECRARFGNETMNRVRVENLSANPVDFVDLGVTPLGVPISVSRG